MKLLNINIKSTLLFTNTFSKTFLTALMPDCPFVRTWSDVNNCFILLCYFYCANINNFFTGTNSVLSVWDNMKICIEQRVILARYFGVERFPVWPTATNFNTISKNICRSIAHPSQSYCSCSYWKTTVPYIPCAFETVL